MAATKNTKAFYNTEIPSDWEVKRLEEVFKLTSGKTKSNELFDKPIDGSIYPVFGGNGIMGFASEFNSEGENILIGRVGEYCGITRFVDEKCWITDNALYSKEYLINIDKKYLAYKLQLEDLSRLRNKGGQPLISQGPINIHKVSLPKSLPEQKAIAQVLGTADAAIQTTEKLITQKELRKKWLMQQLLTGKKRLMGFEGEWKEVRLKDVTTNFSRRNKDLVDAKVYSVTNKSGFVLQSDHFEGKVAGEDLSNYKIIKKNEFAYNPARVNVGSLAYFEEEIGVISSLYVCFKTTKDVLDYFLLQFLQIDHTKHRIEALGEGGVRVYLWYDLFSKIKIKIPTIEEQTAIAQVLQAVDREISLLKAKAEKLREQKKGLMQVLLTGKVRLKIHNE